MKTFLAGFFALCLCVTSAHAQRFVKPANTIGTLTNLNTADVNTNVFVPDLVGGAGGLFSFDRNSVAAPNGTNVFAPAFGTGRWIRVPLVVAPSGLAGILGTGIVQGNGVAAPTAITGTANYLSKWSATAPYLTNSMVFDNGTNVGINLATPLKQLDVAGGGRFTGKASSTITGTADPTASTTLVGTGTLFLTELVVGDRITVNAETRTVTAIASDTSLTVDTAFTDTAASAITKLPAILIVKNKFRGLFHAVWTNKLGVINVQGSETEL